MLFITKLNTNLPIIKRGNAGMITVNKNSYTDTVISFSGFSTPPAVLAYFESGSTGYGMGSLFCVVNNVTKTGATIRVYSADGTSDKRTPTLFWIAIGY